MIDAERFMNDKHNQRRGNDTRMSNEDNVGESAPSNPNGQRPPTGKVLTLLRRFVARGPRKAYREALDAIATAPHLAETAIDAPWIVGVHYDAPGRENYFTGVGAVIDSEWVLTCAHIFSAALDMPQLGEPPTAEKDFFLRVGDPRIGVGKRYEIARKVENDFRPAVGREALRNLREPTNDIVLLRLAACRSGMIKPGEICAANGQTDAAILNGYSGGPGVILPRLGGPAVLAALVSRGADVGDDSIASPGVLTDVTAHRDFIARTIGRKF